MGANLVRGSADRVHLLDAVTQERIHKCVVAVLVLATKDEVDVARKRLDGLDGGVNIGRLGVVVVIDACNRGDVLQPMLNCLKFAHSVANAHGVATAQSSDGNGG